MNYRGLIESYIPENDEMTRYGFISHMEYFIKQLLTSPKSASVDRYLLAHGIDSPKALELLLKRSDPSDENSAILIRTERIKPDVDEDGNSTGKDKFHIKYKLPRKDYMKKMRNLYINTFESHIIEGNQLNEMNANELPSEIKKEKDGDEIKYSFGKNGWGLSDELVKIGKDIKKMSKENNVYINDVNIDTLDDVYDITIKISPITEGAWGTGILENDSALDNQDKFGEFALQYLIDKINNSGNNDLMWANVGVLIDFIKKYKEDELLFTDAFNNAIEFAKNILRTLYHNEEFINSWKNPKEIKSSLKKNFNDISLIKYDKNIMNIENTGNTSSEPMHESVINEDGEGGGATSADASGQYSQPLFGKPIKRTVYLTQEQIDYLKEAVEMDTRFGDFGYDAPPFSKKKDPAYDHKNMIAKSIKK